MVEVASFLKRTVRSPTHEWVTLMRTFASRMVAAVGMVRVPVMPVALLSGMVNGVKVEQ